MYYIIIDLEATIQKHPDAPLYLTEIGAIKLNIHGKVVNRFHSFIRPTDPKYIKDIHVNGKIFTKKEDMINASIVDVVMDRFKKWIHDKDYVLIFWSYSDLELLLSQYKTRRYDVTWIKNYCDLQKVFMDHINTTNQISLKKAIELTNLRFIGTRHNALDDAYNTTKILLWLIEQSAKITFDHNPYEKLSKPLYKKCSKCEQMLYHKKFTRYKGKLQARCNACKLKMKNERIMLEVLKVDSN